MLGQETSLAALGKAVALINARDTKIQELADDLLNAKLGGGAAFHHEPIQTQPLHARHRRHGLAAVLPVQHEQGIDQIRHAQGRFPQQAAAEVMAAHPARADAGEGGLGRAKHGSPAGFERAA